MESAARVVGFAALLFIALLQVPAGGKREP
jgi:hypothetical protein